MTRSHPFFLSLNAILIFTLASFLAGCNPPPNNNLEIDTALGRITHTGTVQAPLGSQPVAGQWVSNITTGSVQPFGTVTSFAGVTSVYDAAAGSVYAAFNQWPTYLFEDNLLMPAYWNIEWEHPPTCLDQTPPYAPQQNPTTYTVDLEPPDNYEGPGITLTCWTNTTANPDFVPTHVSPQFALDSAIPSTLQVAAFDPILAPANITILHVIGTDLSNPANVIASDVASDGSSATFAYPRQSNGASLPAGAYITTITTDPPNATQTTNAMEPFYIAHDDTSYTGAFGVAVAIPQETYRIVSFTPEGGHLCGIPKTTFGNVGGTAFPLVTLATQGKLALGSSSVTTPVGTNPNVVLTFHDNTTYVSQPDELCGSYGGGRFYTYTGAQSALVVNTGSDSITVVNIGQETFPAGTVAVGHQPVAAAINPTETMAYTANYADGTISEVDLNGLQQTRTLEVMAHPTTLVFDTNGNLWVGGQGSVMNVDVIHWTIASTTAIDGTINSMNYDSQSGILIQTVLQNGSASSPPPSRSTMAAAVEMSKIPQTSYTTNTNFNVATLTSSAPVPVFSDNAAYASSPLASSLAFPAQTAISPPIYTSTNGDITATMQGTLFTVTVVGSGQILIQGNLPYPPRGVALSSGMVYFTMPESNSLVSLPIVIPSN